jgi:phage gp36-like protein
LLDLTDRSDPATGEVDEDVVNSALEEADSKVNSYLGKVVALPLAKVPHLVSVLARDIAIHGLHSHMPEIPESVRQRHGAALTLLSDIATGKADLGLADGRELADSTQGSYRDQASGKLSRASLADYAKQ